jgi:hypothetical protein
VIVTFDDCGDVEGAL